jgi:hypothetical protein
MDHDGIVERAQLLRVLARSNRLEGVRIRHVAATQRRLATSTSAECALFLAASSSGVLVPLPRNRSLVPVRAVA